MDNSLVVKPERVDADYPVPSPCPVLLLMVDHPEFPCLIPCDTEMSGPKDTVSLADNRIATVFGKGSHRVSWRCVPDGVIFRIRAAP